MKKGAANIVLKEEGDEDVQNLEEAMEDGSENENEDDSTEGDKMIKQKAGKQQQAGSKKEAARTTGAKGKKKLRSDSAATESPSEGSQSQRSQGGKPSKQKKTLDFFVS